MKIRHVLVGGFGATLIAVLGVVLLSLVMLTQLTSQWGEMSTVVSKRHQVMLKASLHLGYATLHFNTHLHEGGSNEVIRFQTEIKTLYGDAMSNLDKRVAEMDSFNDSDLTQITADDIPTDNS